MLHAHPQPMSHEPVLAALCGEPCVGCTAKSAEGRRLLRSGVSASDSVTHLGRSAPVEERRGAPPCAPTHSGASGNGGGAGVTPASCIHACGMGGAQFSRGGLPSDECQAPQRSMHAGARWPCPCVQQLVIRSSITGRPRGGPGICGGGPS